MNKFNKILSALLAVIMLLGTVTVATGAIPLLDEKGKESNEETDYTVTIEKYLEGEILYTTPQEKLASMKMMWENYGYQLWVDAVTGEVATVKVATGEILFSNPWDTADASYVDSKTGKKKSTSLDIKKRLLSQIIVNYIDNDSEKTMYSCIEAAMRNQINVEYVKNGIRVEYSIGREETRMLVPKLINKDRFQTKILKVMREYFYDEDKIMISDGTIRDENTGKIIGNNTDKYPNATVGQSYGFYELLLMHNPGFQMDGKIDLQNDKFQVKKVAAYYTLKDTEEASSDREKNEIEVAFPITKKMAVYVFDPLASTNEMTLVESYIKNYASSYTYEDLDYDHELTEYVGTDKSPALFKMALEYTIDDQGMSVRLPANGIRFDESLYQLTSVEMLPYMGAGINDGDWEDGGDGYTFYPDGAGTLFDFEQLNMGKNRQTTSKVYGQDYAYHKISGTHQEAVRFPVFGIVSYWEGNKTVYDYSKIKTPAVVDENDKVIKPAVYASTKQKVKEDKGFLAIIEEGDSLAELVSQHLGATSVYNSVKMVFYPRPKDKYNMSDAISVGSNTEMTVVSPRKYVGNYRVRYIMLSDDKLAEENHLANYYECSWMGMAVAYRDYLERKSVLTRLTENDVQKNIPLYIETFGTVMTTEKILSIPVDVMTPLTSFEDVKTMYGEISSAVEDKIKEILEIGGSVGMTQENADKFSNINFKLTGYANGGMFSTMPYNLNWEKAVGGADGFQKLVDYAKKEGFGIFPDFDFVYINALGTLDGVDLKADAVKTIDNRYTSRRQYSATYQIYVGYFQYAVAPSRFERFVTKLTNNYIKYSPIGISVSTMGTDLNSDFDEDDPLNRADSMAYTISALKQLAGLKNSDGERVKVMTDGGNAYTWRYVDYIVNAPLDSSRYNDSSNAVPFIGVVLHGYIQFAGTPINEEGDIEYAFLKAVENGASIYFTLAYQNTQKMKEINRLSEHYSVRYDIWKDDIVEMYVRLNNLLCDLQTKIIIDHEFLIGERVPDFDEVIADEEAKRREEELKAAEEAVAAVKEALKAALTLRHTPTQSVETVESAIANVNEQAIIIAKYVAKIKADYVDDCAGIITEVNAAKVAVAEAKKNAYDEQSYDAAVENAENKISARIMNTAIAAAEKVLRAAKDGAGDAAEAAVAVKVESEFMAAVIRTGAVRIFEMAVNEEPTYKSSAEADKAAEEEAKAVIAAVAETISEKGTQLVVEAGENGGFASRLISAMTADIEDTFTVDFVKNLITETANIYSRANDSSEKVINSAADTIVALNKAFADAEANGVKAEDIRNAIALKQAVDMIVQKMTALETNRANYTKSVTALKTLNTAYYNAVEAVYVKIAGSDSALVNAVKAINAYNAADADAKMYELTYELDKVDSSKTNAENQRKAANDKKAVVDALDATVRTNAQAIVATADAMIKASTDDLAAGYAKVAELVNDYFDKVEKLYVDAAGTDAAVVEAVKVLNNKNRYDALLVSAQLYNLKVGNVASATAYAAVNASVAEMKAAEAALTEAVKTKAQTAITSKKSAVDALDKTAYETEILVFKAASECVSLANGTATRDGYVADYKEYFETNDANKAARTAAEAALANEKISVAKTEANNAFNAAVTAYEKVAASDAIAKAAGITALIDAITNKKASYVSAEAAYTLQVTLVDADKFGATSSEMKELNSKLNARNSALLEFENAESELAAAREASAHKTEFNAVVDAYNALNDAKIASAKIDNVTKASANVTAAVYKLDEKSRAAAESMANYTMLKNTLTAATADYSSYLKTIKSAFTKVDAYLETAKTAVKNAEAATKALDERRDTTKTAAAEAAVQVKIYAAAVLAASNTVDELNALLEKATAEEAENINNAIAAKAEAVSDNAIVEAAKKAVAENSADALDDLYKSAVAAKATADREVISAEQFYNTAVAETATAQAKLDTLIATYNANVDLINGIAVLKAKAELFGEDNMTTAMTGAGNDIRSANDNLTNLIKYIAIIDSNWAELRTAADVYKAAKAEYDELGKKISDKSIEKLTESEKTEFRSRRIELSYKILDATDRINSAKNAIATANSSFRKEFTSIGSYLTSIETSVKNAEAEAQVATALYNKVAATSSDAEYVAKLREQSERYTEIATSLRAGYDAIFTSYKNDICAKAAELGLIVARDESLPLEERQYNLVTIYSDADKFANEVIKGEAGDEEEKAEVTKYTCNDGSIVAVTYGGKDGNDADPYRTFLLNYNSFTVTVNYNGKDYSIGAYGYVVINH